jgi:hypothetical protein
MKTTFIYSLSDPRTNQIRYIGKSDNPKIRLESHLKDKKFNHKVNWIRSLSILKLKPIVEVVDEVAEDEWQFWEIHYISLFKSWGFKLTNSTLGGEGLSDPTGEIAKKISESLKGQVQSKETKQKRGDSLRDAYKQKPRSKAFYDKIVKTRYISGGFMPSEESKKKNSKTHKELYKEGKVSEAFLKQAGRSMIGKENPASRTVMQYNMQGNFIKEWESARQAGNFLNKSACNISNGCKGKENYNKVYGYIWRYKTSKEGELPNTKESILESIEKIKFSKEANKKRMQDVQKQRWSKQN